MSVSFQCPYCQASHTLSEQLAGRRYRCPSCDSMIDVTDSGQLLIDGAPVRPPGERERWKRPGLRETRSRTESYPSDDGPLMLDAVDVIPPEAMLQGMAGGSGPAIPPARDMVTEDDDDDAPRVRKSRLGDTEMDMTPMVDVTFQLLIFFMITAAFALQKAKEIPKPKDQDPSTTPVIVEPDDVTDLVVVRVDENNTFTVINTDGDEDEAPSVQDLYIKLRRAKAGGSSGQLPTRMRVEAHGDSLHEKVVAALDAGNETGFVEIELATAAEDEE